MRQLTKVPREDGVYRIRIVTFAKEKERDRERRREERRKKKSVEVSANIHISENHKYDHSLRYYR